MERLGRINGYAQVAEVAEVAPEIRDATLQAVKRCTRVSEPGHAGADSIRRFAFESTIASTRIEETFR